MALKMTEAQLQETITEALDLGGWRWVHFRPARTKHGWTTAMSGHKGFPDIVAVRDRVLFLELKSDSGTVHVEQTEWLRVLRSAGVDARVVRPPDLDQLLVELLSQPRRRRQR